MDVFRNIVNDTPCYGRITAKPSKYKYNLQLMIHFYTNYPRPGTFTSPSHSSLLAYCLQQLVHLVVLISWLRSNMGWHLFSEEKLSDPKECQTKRTELGFSFHLWDDFMLVVFFGLLPHHLSVVEDASTQSMWCTLLSGWARLAFSPSQWDPSSKHTNTLYAWHKTQ